MPNPYKTMSKPIPVGTPVEGDMTAALDSRFLNSIVLQGALDRRAADALEVVIDRIEQHDLLKYENGQTAKNAHLIYFKGSDKPLKLGATNAKRLIMMLGTIGKGWHGQKVSLCIEQQYRPDLKGIGPCVRVKITHDSERAKARMREMTGGDE